MCAAHLDLPRRLGCCSCARGSNLNTHCCESEPIRTQRFVHVLHAIVTNLRHTTTKKTRGLRFMQIPNEPWMQMRARCERNWCAPIDADPIEQQNRHSHPLDAPILTFLNGPILGALKCTRKSACELKKCERLSANPSGTNISDSQIRRSSLTPQSSQPFLSMHRAIVCVCVSVCEI